MKAAPSLRRQLLWFVLAAIALVSVLQAGTAYRSALAQADALFDEQVVMDFVAWRRLS